MATPEKLRLWRKEQRAKLLARRLAVPAAQRRDWNNAIAKHLAQGFSTLPLKTAGFYWPCKGEFDPRSTMRLVQRCGVTVALPAVIGKDRPLEFREWRPGVPMTRGVLDLPFPTDAQLVTPDALLIPLLGFDQSGFRLGFGGGYFDRTLAAMRPQPLKLGVGFECSALATIHPQSHDIAMDFVITEAGIHAVGEEGLMRIATHAAAAEQASVIAGRRRAGNAHIVAAVGAAYSSPPCYAHEFDICGDASADDSAN